MLPVHLQSFMLPCPTVYEMHLYENTVFDLLPWVGVNVLKDVAQSPLHYVTYSYAKFKVATSNGFERDAFKRKFII